MASNDNDKDIVRDIRDLLQSVKYDGYHFTHGIIQDPRMSELPMIQVENCGGKLTYPVSPEKAQELIRKAAPSPFGLGEKTLVDDKVRKTWQFEPEQVKMDEQSWDKTLEKIVAEVKKGLGVPNEVKAVFHKLLIYGEGCFFKRHADSKKEDGMFATLSVQLPSLFEGGSFSFEHLSHSEDVDLSVNCETSLKWTAWYADTFHEVAPLTSGYRVALVYNLVRGPIPVKKGRTTGNEEATESSVFDYIRLLPELKEKISEWRSTLSEKEEDVEMQDEDSELPSNEEKEEKKESGKRKRSDVAELIKAINKKMIVCKLDHLYTLSCPVSTSFEDYAYTFDFGNFDEVTGNANADHRILFGGIPPSEFSWIDRLNGRDRNVALLLCRAAAQKMLNVSLVLQDLYLESGYDRGSRGSEFVTLKVLKDGTTEKLPWLFGAKEDGAWCVLREEAEGNFEDGREMVESFDCVYQHQVQYTFEELQFGNNGVEPFHRYRIGFLVIEPPTIVDAEE